MDPPTPPPPAGLAASAAPPLTPPACVPLLPTAGAVTYWPERWAAGAEAPPARSASAAAVWALELCGGNVPAAPAGAAAASDFDLPLPGGYCSGCAGVLRVMRQLGCPASAACGSGAPANCSAPAPPLAPGSPPEVVADARALGPDELHVVLEGGEFLLLRGEHVGGCAYNFPFRLSIPGLYRVVAVALHADWDALQEETVVFPRLTLDNLAGDGLFVTLGRAGDAEPARALVRAAGDRLPACSAPSPPGRWVSSGAPHGAPPRVQAPLPYGPGIAYSTNLTPGEPLGLDFFPFSCRWPRHHAVEVGDPCFAGRAFHFEGDSQLRSLFNHAMFRLIGVPHAAVKGVEGAQCVDSRPGKTPGAGLVSTFLSCYGVDPLGESVPLGYSQNPAEPDPFALVVNFGQHWAAEHRVSAGAYAAAVEAYIEGAEARAAAAVARLVWVESFPLNILNHEFVHAHNDGRTAHRLRLYNAAARRALQPAVEAKRVRILDAFDVLAPVLDASADHAHQDGLPSLDPIVFGLLALLCGPNP
jgi:hypothetical protein